MKKNAPRIIAVVLLIAIAVMLIVSESESLVMLFESNGNDAEKLSNNQNNVANATNNGDNDSENPTDNVPEPVLEDIYPKLSNESNRYLFTQEVEVLGNVSLEKVISTAGAVYLVISSDSQGKDFNVFNKTVSVIKMTDSGTLTKIAHASVAGDQKFIDASLTQSGIALVVSAGGAVHITHFDLELNSENLIVLPNAQNGRIFTFSKAYILLLERDINTVYYIESEKVIKQTSITGGKVQEIFESNESFVLFLNSADGYTVTHLDLDLKSYEIINIFGKILLNVCPVADKGALSYIAVERVGGTVWLSKYTASYKLSYAVPLASADSSVAYLNGESVLVLLESADRASRLYLANSDLDTTVVTSGALKDVSALHHCLPYFGGFYLLANENSQLTLIDLRNDGSVSRRIISHTPRDANFVIRQNGTVHLFYEEGGNFIKIVGVSA
ncbi:MAG: hypothetical protein FWD49_07355 [Firmicutes bacterium]|nr:hypothetical protein [Bacillota bacterium]